MESYLSSGHFDLVTPDGVITKLTLTDESHAEATVFIDKIDEPFVGFDIDRELVFFNLKSTLAQLGLQAYETQFELDRKAACARVHVQIECYGPLARKMLGHLHPGIVLGKLFAADDRRRVRNPDYVSRMFGRSDRWGRPLLSLGGMQGSDDLLLEQVDGRAVAYLTLQSGRVSYDEDVGGFLPTLAKALCSGGLRSREMLRLHQQWQPNMPRNVEPDEILLVRTLPLHIRTVFARVCEPLLASGYKHTSASVLEPTTQASGDIYELFGNSQREISDIPVEFYTLEPHREHVFFSDRDQLKSSLEDDACIFQAFRSAPGELREQACVFVVKGEQLLNLREKDWILRQPRSHEFPGIGHPTRHALMVERYIQQQPAYAFLKAIDDGLITSQGILLSRYFPTPLLKRMLLSNQVQYMLKGIYFQFPSASGGSFFSQEDRYLLHDLITFAIPVYWVDGVTGRVLQYVSKPFTESGLFVPLNKVDTYLQATVFGVYGSNLLEGDFELELCSLMEGLLQMRAKTQHSQLGPNTPLALVTGGGPGAMEVGNRVAQKLDILSCANIVDFGHSDQEAVVNEQRQNPHVEAKMTYRLDKLVERQAEFNLDFPIFLQGGIGTDFEYSLEEVRRKVGGVEATPIILFGHPDYWRAKVTGRFQCNLRTGTISGSEWISNCFYCIQTAEQGIDVYKRFFEGKLPIGKNGPVYEDGFVDMTREGIWVD